MVSNPMQRKSRTSFIVGLLLGLFITGAIAAFFAYQLKVMNDAEKARIAKEKIVYTLVRDIKSGETVTADMFQKTSVTSDAVPSDAMTPGTLEETTIAKVDLMRGTILTQAVVQDSENKTTDDLRMQEYNMIKLSSQLQTGDYIDIRLRLPSGLDYIVVSKKKVEIPEVNGIPSSSTIWLKMTEAETLVMDEAIVETYMMEGGMLYTTSYIEPGLQAEATPTFVANEATVNLISQNPNVVKEAATAIYNRHTNDRIGIRGKIDTEINKDIEKAAENVNSKTAAEITSSQTLRKNYLDSLAGY